MKKSYLGLLAAVLITSCTPTSTKDTGSVKSIANQPETLRGRVISYNMTPQGEYESFFVKIKDRLVQVNVPPKSGDQLVEVFPVGSIVELNVTKRPGYNARDVYDFESYKTLSGILVKAHKEESKVSETEGYVKAYNFDRNGEIDAVIIDTGDLVHLGSNNTLKEQIKIGDKIRARGEKKQLLNAKNFIQAQEVDRVEPAESM